MYQNDVWKGNRPVLICTDYILNVMENKIHYSDFLIHFNLPNDVNTFRQRFSVILHRVQQLASEVSSTSSATTKPEVRYFIDGSDSAQIPRLRNIISQLHINPKIPAEVQEKLSEYAKRREMDRPDICLNLQQFGKCDNEKTCKSRHIFIKEKDSPNPLLPMSGQIHVHVVRVYSPTHFRVRLIEYKNDQKKWIQSSIMDSSALAIKLKLYFDKNKARAVENVIEGDLFAVEELDPSRISSTYERVRVMKIIDGQPQKVQLSFVDSGKKAIKPLSSLRYLPPEFTSIPETTIDVFVANLQPIDQDITWGEIFSAIIDNKIREEMKNGKVKFIANVQLVIGSCIWVDSLHTYTFYKLLNEDVAGVFSVSKYLLTEKLAIRNTNHLKALRQKCIAAGLLTPESSNDAVSNSENVGNEPKNLVNGHANCNNIGNGLENNEATEDTVRNGDTIPSKTSLFKKPDRPAPKRKNKCVENEGIKPLVYWWQDNTSITLTIRKNVNEDYTITHDGRRRICFQGTEGNTLYKFDETLFACFVSKTLHHYKSGVTVVVKIEKLSKEIKWKRILKDREPAKWIREEIHEDSDSDSPQHAERRSIHYTRENLPSNTIAAKFNHERLPDEFTPTSSEAASDDDEFGQGTLDD